MCRSEPCCGGAGAGLAVLDGALAAGGILARLGAAVALVAAAGAALAFLAAWWQALALTAAAALILAGVAARWLHRHKTVLCWEPNLEIPERGFKVPAVSLRSPALGSAVAHGARHTC